MEDAAHLEWRPTAEAIARRRAREAARAAAVDEVFRAWRSNEIGLAEGAKRLAWLGWHPLAAWQALARA